MLQPFGNHAKSERLHASGGFVTVLAIGHDTRQGGNFGHPAAIVFALNFNRERHSGDVPFRPGV